MLLLINVLPIMQMISIELTQGQRGSSSPNTDIATLQISATVHLHEDVKVLNHRLPVQFLNRVSKKVVSLALLNKKLHH